MTRVAFLGGKPLGARCLELLVEHPDADVAGVVCRRRDQTGWWTGEGRRVIDVAEEHGLPLLQEADLLDLELDLAISVLYFRIIRRPLIDHLGGRIVNLHPAPLPYYRGSNSYSHAIINGETRYGVTLHEIDEGIDTGPLIAVRWLEIGDATARELHDRSAAEAAALFHDLLPDLLALRYETVDQTAALENGAVAHEYTKTSLEPLKRIDPRDLAERPEETWRLVRGLDFPPHEPAYVLAGDRKVYLRAGPRA